MAGSYAPSLGGNVPSYMNSGKMDNRGFELVLKHNNHFSSGWRYSLTGSLSWARNKVLAKHISDDHPMYRAILGQPRGSSRPRSRSPMRRRPPRAKNGWAT